MASLLFNKTMLLSMVIAWAVFVVAGSAISLFMTQHTILTNTELNRILTPRERLADNTNVAYVPKKSTQKSSEAGNRQDAEYPTRLIIPKIGTDLPIANPTTRNIAALDKLLTKSSVRYPDSATLGVSGGNILLFGHSSHLPFVYNKLYKAFNNIETLKIGDRIELRSGNDIYTYRVSRVYKSNAKDGRIPLSVQGQRLTLLTCNSFGLKSDRWVVESELIGKNI